EAVIEGGDAGGHEPGIAVVDADFSARAGLRSKRRRADEGDGALTADADDPGDELLDGWRLGPPAHATLDRPPGRRGPGQTGARAHVSPEGAVVVAAKADGEGERIREAPLVLDEQRPLGVLERCGGDTVDHVGVPELAADGERVGSEVADDLGVE